MYANNKNLSEYNQNSGKNMHLNFTIKWYNPVSLMKSIIELELTFENNSDIEVKVTQKKSVIT